MKRIQFLIVVIALSLSGRLVAQTAQRPEPAFDFVRTGSLLTVKSTAGKALVSVDLERPAFKGKVVAFTYSAKKKKVFQSPENAAQSVNVFPNPVSGQVNLRLKESWKLPVEVQIFSKSGTLVKTARLNGTDSSIDISSLQQGTYIMKIAGQNTSAVQTLMVQ